MVKQSERIAVSCKELIQRDESRINSILTKKLIP